MVEVWSRLRLKLWACVEVLGKSTRDWKEKKIFGGGRWEGKERRKKLDGEEVMGMGNGEERRQ